jgi:hypothetical protein
MPLTVTHQTGWWAEFYAAFTMTCSPTIGFTASPRFTILITPALTMDGIQRDGGQFALQFGPVIAMGAGTHSTATLNLAVTPTIGMAPILRGVLALSLSPSIGFAKAEHYAQSFSVNITPALAMPTVAHQGSSNIDGGDFTGTGVGVFDAGDFTGTGAGAAFDGGTL